MNLGELINQVKDKVGPAAYGDDAKIVSAINSSLRELALIKPMWIQQNYQQLNWAIGNITDMVLNIIAPDAIFYIATVVFKDGNERISAEYIDYSTLLYDVIANRDYVDTGRVFYSHYVDQINNNQNLVIYPVSPTNTSGVIEIVYYSTAVGMQGNDEEVVPVKYFPDYIIYLASAKLEENLGNIEKAMAFRNIANDLLARAVSAIKLKEALRANIKVVPVDYPDVVYKRKNIKGEFYE